MTAVLEGIKVLDLSRVVAGPVCTMTLGDLGADVVKVERVGAGDDTRRWGPPYLGDQASYFLALNRNKRSLTLDFKDERGKQIIRRLAREADVVVENYKTGTLDRLGLGYEELRKDNPGLIWVSITGYGLSGPHKDLPGYDFVIQGRGGLMSITGEPDGQPMSVGVPIVDITAAYNAVISVLAALRVRDQTGRGQLCEISLLDTQVAWLINQGSNYLTGGVTPHRSGNHHPSITPYESFRAKDAWFNIAVGNDGQFRRLCEVLGADELPGDPRFATNPARVENRETLHRLLTEYFEVRTAQEWVDTFFHERIPCGPINTIPEVFADEQVLARGMVVELPHPTTGSVKVVGSPLRLHDAPVTFRRHPPLLGEHTDEVLGELGYDPDAVAALRAEGVV